jgi:integrase
MKTGAPRGQGRVFRRGDVWWVAFSHRGREYRESSKSTNRTEALKLLRRRLGEVGIGRFVGTAAERVMVHELLDLVEADYELAQRRSLKRVRHARVPLLEEFGPDLALEVSPPRLEDYVARRRRDGAALATIQYELAILRRGFTLAVRRQLLPFRPSFPTLRVDNARQGFFERDGLERVRAALPEALRNVVTFAYLTGWRVPSEVLPLTWDRVDFAAGVVRLDVRTTKNGAGRTFPFDVLPELAELLRRQRLYTDLFEASGGQAIAHVFHRAGRPVRDFSHAWRKACAAAGLGGRIPHDFRRTAARNLLRAGVPESWAMQLTGHKTAAIFRRYAITNDVDLREAVTRLAGLERRQPKATTP